jgi:hypothetical protein
MRLLQLYLGIGIISFIIWRIFILERIPYNLTYAGILQGIIIGCIMLWNIVEVISIISQLNKRTPWQSGIVKKIRKLVDMVYWKPLSFVGIILCKEPIISYSLDSIEKLLLKRLVGKLSIALVVLFFPILPRLILGCTLYVDIIVYRQLRYMYMIIPIVMISLIFNSIVGMIKQRASRDKEELENKYIIADTIKGSWYLQAKNCSIKAFENNKNLWIQAYNVIDLCTAIEIVKNSKIILIMRLITVEIYILSWFQYIAYIVIKLIIV